MGEDPQKIKEIATRAREAREAAQAEASTAAAGDKTEVTAPVAAKEEGGAAHQAAVAAMHAAARAEVSANTSSGPAVTKEAAAKKIPGSDEAKRVDAATAPAAEPHPSAPKAVAVAQPKAEPAEKAASELAQPKKTSVPKLRPRVPTPVASDPPTLRTTDARETPARDAVAAPRRPASAPPRPERRVTPTPGTRLAAVTDAAAADRAAVLPLTVKTPSKPPTEPPPAQRSTRDERQFEPPSDPPPHLEGKMHALADEEPSVPSQQILPPPSEPTPDPFEGSRALVFQAESPPIEHSPAPPEVREHAAPATADEPEPGSFMPTMPPKRLLTSAEALSQKRASGARMGVWLMGGLAIALLSLVAFWLNSHPRSSAPSPAASNTPTLEQHLSSAAGALHVGDLVRAHDQLQSSQTLGGRDPRWIVLTARYDVMRADMNWLAVRLADPTDSSHVDALKRELADHVAQASRALTSIERLAVKDPELFAARVDAQRLRGELDEARKGVQGLDKANPSPEIAYTLANLELLADNPDYKRIFEWLGVARAADAGLGRAPAALVVACVLSHRLDCARAELERLKSAGRAHPLLPDIEAFVGRAEAQAAPTSSASVAPQASAAALLDAGLPSPVAAASAAASDSANADLTGDFRVRLRRGFEALARNELTRAEQLFRSVIADRPTDTEALTGLGDVARRRNNTTSAISYYQKVLASNGQYLPALSALADVKWRSGDRAGAAPLYRRILDQVGESAGYGQTAAQRLRELSEAKPSASAESDKPSAPASTAKHSGSQP
jgi:tetratricopeptide (TPR) repeat protein